MRNYGWKDVSWNPAGDGARKLGVDLISGSGDQLSESINSMYDGYSENLQANEKAKSAANTADFIAQIRAGKDPELTGGYDGMAISDARENQKRYNQELAFKRAAEARSAATHRASLAGNKGTSDFLQKYVNARSESSPVNVEKLMTGRERTSAEEDRVMSSILKSGVDSLPAERKRIDQDILNATGTFVKPFDYSIPDSSTLTDNSALSKMVNNVVPDIYNDRNKAVGDVLGMLPDSTNALRKSQISDQFGSMPKDLIAITNSQVIDPSIGSMDKGALATAINDKAIKESKLLDDSVFGNKKDSRTTTLLDQYVKDPTKASRDDIKYGGMLANGVPANDGSALLSKVMSKNRTKNKAVLSAARADDRKAEQEMNSNEAVYDRLTEGKQKIAGEIGKLSQEFSDAMVLPKNERIPVQAMIKNKIDHYKSLMSTMTSNQGSLEKAINRKKADSIKVDDNTVNQFSNAAMSIALGNGSQADKKEQLRKAMLKLQSGKGVNQATLSKLNTVLDQAVKRIFPKGMGQNYGSTSSSWGKDKSGITMSDVANHTMVKSLSAKNQQIVNRATALLLSKFDGKITKDEFNAAFNTAPSYDPNDHDWYKLGLGETTQEIEASPKEFAEEMENIIKELRAGKRTGSSNKKNDQLTNIINANYSNSRR
jgi:hypothetical protein